MTIEFDNAKAEAEANLEKIRLSNGGGRWERQRRVKLVGSFIDQWAGVAASGSFEQDKAEAEANLERIRTVTAGDGWERERLVNLVVNFINEWGGVEDV
jgi:hypothetical protein